MYVRHLVTTGTLIAALCATMLVGISALAGATAQAATPGTPSARALTLTPVTGQDTTAAAVRTSTGCPAGADGYNLVVSGPGAFADGVSLISTSSANFSTTEPISAAFGLTMRDAASRLGTTIAPGRYVVTFNCVDAVTGEVQGIFVGSMHFTSATSYHTTEPIGSLATTTPPATTTTSATGTPTTVTPTTGASTTTPTSSQTTTTTPGGGCSLELNFATPDDLPPFLTAGTPTVEIADLEAFFAAFDADLNALEAFASCLAVSGTSGACEAPTAIDFEPFRNGESEDIDALLAASDVYFSNTESFLACLGVDPTGGSSTTTSPTTIADTTSPPSSGGGAQNSGGTQTIGVSTKALGQTGGPVGLIFLSGLALFAGGLALIIVARRPRKGLE